MASLITVIIYEGDICMLCFLYGSVFMCIFWDCEFVWKSWIWQPIIKGVYLLMDPLPNQTKTASNGNNGKDNGKGESTERNVFGNAPPPAHSNTAQPAWVDQLIIWMSRYRKLKTKWSLSFLCNKIESIQNRVSHLGKFTGNIGNTIGDIRKVQNDIKSSIKNTGKDFFFCL
jgi:hypothetical protein